MTELPRSDTLPPPHAHGIQLYTDENGERWLSADDVDKASGGKNTGGFTGGCNEEEKIRVDGRTMVHVRYVARKILARKGTVAPHLKGLIAAGEALEDEFVAGLISGSISLYG